MDSTTMLEERNRFESFKLGKGIPPTHKHARSHSRNQSISSPFSFGPSNDVPPTNPAPSTKRNSHHRRRSSVSTRRESAELMGVSLPDLPLPAPQDNVNLGEKDSIRRRALLALEGKPDMAFSKVEIPELSTPDMEKMMFDFATKSSAPSTFGKRDSLKLLGPSASSKDQLHTLVEEEEEEEEEVTQTPQQPAADDVLPSPASSTKDLEPTDTPGVPAIAVAKSTPSRPRPATLNLRPLALIPDSMTQGLPTPVSTPNPRPGMRTLSLASSDTDEQEVSFRNWRNSFAVSPNSTIWRKTASENDSAPAKSDDSPKRRSSISYKRSSGSGGLGLPTPDMTPTFGRYPSRPESSSTSSADDEFFPSTRSLSASEQHFLFKSHHALLARITDLERALTMRRRVSSGYSVTSGSPSRPVSVASSQSQDSSEPNDEMLQLVTDLKAERDELKRDVEGWRARVSDLETQTSTLAKRVEGERREAWVARSRINLLEVEKTVLATRLEAVDQLVGLHEREKASWDGERRILQKDNDELKAKVSGLENELVRIKKELAAEKMQHSEALDPMATPTPRSFDTFSRQIPVLPPRRHNLGLMSVDSESSATDVEPDSSDDGHRLKAVEEEEEDFSDEDSGLTGYEDEEDSDAELTLQSSSSFGSDDDDASRRFSHHQDAFSPPTMPSPPVPPRPTHVSRATLSRTWTFPTKMEAKPRAIEPEERDHFFECIGDIDSESSGSVPSSPSAYSYEKSKGLFSSGFKFAGDDTASFFIPSGIGMPASDSGDIDNKGISFVEEDADEEVQLGHHDLVETEEMFGEMGGICITFTPPQDEVVKEEVKQIQLVSPTKRTSPPPTLPALDFGNDEEEEEQENTTIIPINFGSPLVDEPLPTDFTLSDTCQLTLSTPSPTPPVSVPVATIPLSRPSSPSMIPQPSSPSIPRTTSSRPSVYTSRFTPAKAGVSSPLSLSDGFVSPPSKRGVALPSFIPQPVSYTSASPIRTATVPNTTKPKVIPQSTFIRQPSRKPLLPSMNNLCYNQTGSGGSTNGSTSISQIPSRRSSERTQSTPIDVTTSLSQVRSSSKDDTVEPSSSSSFSSIVSAPLQTLSNFIPLSWGSRPSVSLSVQADYSCTPTTLDTPKKRGFATREKQLKALKTRMEVQKFSPLYCTVVGPCKNCREEIVSL